MRYIVRNSAGNRVATHYHLFSALIQARKCAYACQTTWYVWNTDNELEAIWSPTKLQG